MNCVVVVVVDGRHGERLGMTLRREVGGRILGHLKMGAVNGQSSPVEGSSRGGPKLNREPGNIP